MVQLTASFVALATALLAGQSAAHPGHDARAEAAERAAYRATAQYRSLAHCADALKAREPAMIERRKAAAEQLRRRQFIEKRDYITVLGKSHHSNASVTPNSADSVTFANNNASCVLQAEETEGPFYVTGEWVRRNISEVQKGVALTFDVQIIDVSTCKPISNVAVEAWHANSTGVYSGVGSGNGNGNAADTTNINNTFNRGIQFTDSDGVATYDTTFPGHYTGRCNHIHILAHINATQLANSTISGGHISHVGQLFFDQDLISEVEATSPYSTNTNSLLQNKDDSIFIDEATTTDPILTYVLLGNTVSSGVFGWITVGIDPTVSKTVSAAANHDASGGHANSNSGGGGPGGMPTGGFPGSRPTSTATA